MPAGGAGANGGVGGSAAASGAGTHAYAGGFAGANESGRTIKDSWSTGTVTLYGGNGGG